MKYAITDDILIEDGEMFALRRFAALHGRNWRSWLRAAWASDNYPTNMTEHELDNLRHLKEIIGYTGLKKIDISHKD